MIGVRTKFKIRQYNTAKNKFFFVKLAAIIDKTMYTAIMKQGVTIELSLHVHDKIKPIRSNIGMEHEDARKKFLSSYDMFSSS